MKIKDKIQYLKLIIIGFENEKRKKKKKEKD